MAYIQMKSITASVLEIFVVEVVEKDNWPEQIDVEDERRALCASQEQACKQHHAK